MDNSLEAFSSNPRYSPDGLDAEIEKEELAEARKVDAQNTAMADLQEETPEDKEGFDALNAHEKILGVVDNATRIPRDFVGGALKAVDNTMALVVGRENLDSANEWIRKEMPDLATFTDNFAQGVVPRGTVSEVTQEMSQFMIPFGAYMKGLTALSAASGVKAGAFTTGFAADVIASGTALDPHVERFSALAKEMGMDNKIIGWLADNENETESEGRLKNMVENAGLGIGLTAAFMASALTLKGLWRASKVPRKAIKKIAKKKVKKKEKPDIDGKIKDLLKEAEKL